MGANSIRYLFHAKTGIELIFCENSTISYPVHNHVSVLTVGILLDGAIILRKQKLTGEMKPLPYYHIRRTALLLRAAIPCSACALIKMQ